MQDPTLQELQVVGAQLQLQAQPHLLLGGCFYVSGFIPRITPYEEGNPMHVTQMVGPASCCSTASAL
jgi:7,8-dihydropterin-6-yl-methyl-4-(beta-D-ribofuranosyl)aminobenzene 5'-phosphate synthase